MDELKQRLEQAIEAGQNARHTYYTSIDLDDAQELGDPTPEADILKLEAQLGRPLPPSYRQFLLLHNGWQEIDGGVDLLPIEELLGQQDDYDIPQWQRDCRDDNDEVAARSLVIGASAITATKYLLDPGVIDTQGEWRLLQYHHEMEAELPSFIQWLEESVDEYLELADMDPEDDEDDYQDEDDDA